MLKLGWQGSEHGAPTLVSAWGHVTRVFTLSDGRWVGRALPEINFRGQRCSKPGGAWATSTCVTGPRSHLKGLGPCLGCTRRVCVLGVAHRAAWVSGAAAAAESERGEQVPLEEWMMMILVVLRLRRLLMVEMVKLKQHLLLFLGPPFLQYLESIFHRLLLRSYWTMTTLLPLAASLLMPLFHHQRIHQKTAL
uniref:Coiled-coil domain containing 91 n=1 Tax=Papio anubis TaxID=9555 RepID=A0A2I3M8H7_PAPAN